MEYTLGTVEILAFEIPVNSNYLRICMTFSLHSFAMRTEYSRKIENWSNTKSNNARNFGGCTVQTKCVRIPSTLRCGIKLLVWELAVKTSINKKISNVSWMGDACTSVYVRDTLFKWVNVVATWHSCRGKGFIGGFGCSLAQHTNRSFD